MRRALGVVVAGFLVAGGLVPAMVDAAVAQGSSAGRIVSDEPAAGTPHVLDGGVYSIAQVGTTMVLGGTFTTARDDSSDTHLTRTGLLAFDTVTDKISTTFVPEPNGDVTTVIPAGDGSSVYVAGSFTSIGGVARSKVARLRVSDGAVLPGFDAGTVNGTVKDLRLRDGRLWLAGAFTHVNGRAQKALATVNATTGAVDSYMSLAVAGVHNSGTTTVSKIDVNAQGTRLVAVGNFDTLAGVKRHQLLMLDLTGPKAVPADFQTAFYESACSKSFDSNMRDLDFSPDGSFFVVSTTGAYGGPDSSCDSTARWETGSTGSGLKPSWVDYTGGDTTYAVEVTDSVVYTGGHARWQNNAFSGDTPGPGAVSRPGIAALDPSNGLPLSWNPTRTRGVGVFDFLVTSQGLWVASNTDRIGSYRYHGRIALMPLAGGKNIPTVATPSMPNDVYAGGASGAASDPSVLYRVNAGGPQLSASTGIDWAADTADSPSPYENGVGSRASWDTVGTVSPDVTAGTPRSLWSSELWDPPDNAEQAWSFPVAAGTPLQVRLYFANRCSCTSAAGQRVFNVDLDGRRVLPDFDISASAGNNVGIVKTFDITSDGDVNIDLSHAAGFDNPLVNGIEILRTDVASSAPSQVVRHTYGAGQAGPAMAVPAGDVDWNRARGAFMVNGQLYLAGSDGSFVRRSFDGTTYGAPVAVDAQDELTRLADWYDDIASATGMFFDSGRIYFTEAGSDQLYYRYFSPESDVVGAKRFVASGSVAGIDLSRVRGMFVSGEKLFWATPDGALHSIGWAHQPLSDVPVAGTASQVSGPGVDGTDWTARTLFLFQDAAGRGASQPATADFSARCTGLACDFDASASASPGASISSYRWQFGDGTTASGVSPSHTFGSAGSPSVRLEVTSSNGTTAVSTHTLTVSRTNAAPTASFTTSCDGLSCTVDASGSSDPDADPLSFAWDFGDGTSGTGASPSHTYPAAGQRTVNLRVSDGTLSGSTSRDVTVSPAATVGFAGAASTAGNRTAHTVQVPASVRPGDTMVLFMTANSTTTTISDALPGWTMLSSADGSGVRTRAWSRTATAADAGTTVTVRTSDLTKSVLSLSAYRGSAGGSSVTASAARVVNTSEAAHATPAAMVPTVGSWVVSWWSEKSSDALTWTAPEGTSVRTQASGSGSGKVSAILGDSNGPVPTGTTPGLSASTSLASTRGAMTTVVVAPR